MVTVIKTGVVEFMVLIVRLFATLMTAFIRHVFFFWPRKYKNITGDAILITGGGKGIGRVIAMEFAKRRPKQVHSYASVLTTVAFSNVKTTPSTSF